MHVFFPEQRWTSEAEPELGVGIVTETSKGRVRIHFSVSGESRLYASASAPLRRVRFKQGETIIDVRGRSMMIEKVREDGDLIMYFGDGKMLSEADLGNVSVSYGAEDRLLMGDVDTPEIFALRRRTLQNDHNRRISSVNGFVGGRIDLIPHQLYIAHEASVRYAPRVLLSDEVGLGKTIEACLILHRLLLQGRISRVMILVPESLIHQWFVEMLRRFNLWFHIFDEERCAAIDESAPDGNPFLDDQLVICSTDFLANSPRRSRQARKAGWDMLVVDEAHHLEWSVERAGREYKMVESLSQVAVGLLLLTATPEQLGLESHFARLRLLDPDRYSDFASFKNESIDHRETADVVGKLSEGKSLKTKDAKFLKSLFGQERLDAVLSGNDSARDNMIEDLLDQHGPGRVVFRNTRSAMTGFPARKVHIVPLEAEKEAEQWLHSARNEFSGDLNSARQNFLFKNDPRLVWLIELMESLHPAKVLLICKSKEKVFALEQALKKLINLKVGIFHEDLSLVQRDRNAAWFSESDGARLLLCSEIGSEGRNFQFAHHLVLFDLPLNPELLEQRIGRLDRIGQTKDIQIHVPFLQGSPQEVLVRWFHEGLNAFEKNLEGGNQIAQLFGDRLLKVASATPSPDTERQLSTLIADTNAFHLNLRQTLANGRDRLLEMNSFRPEIARKLIEQIKSEDQSRTLETYMTQVFEHFRIEMEDLAPRTYYLHPPHNNISAFPTIPDDGITVTFDRKRALSREEVSFLSWDHPMTTGALDMVLSSGTGSASFGRLRSTGAPAILLELLFVLETVGGSSLNVDRFLPNTPLRVIVDHSGTEVTAQYPIEEMDKQLKPGLIDDLIENETLVETIIPNMVAAATEIAETRGQLEILHGLRRMNSTLDHEIGRLQSLKKKSAHIRPEEIRIASKEQEKLAALIKDARIRLDSVQLIQKGGF